jgi:hypothetical protein
VALFDGQGRLIGITTVTRPDFQNLNFAMPGGWVQAVQKTGTYFVGQTLEYGLIDRITSGHLSV